MSLTKLSLWPGWELFNYSVFPPRESLVSDIPAGDGNVANLFLQCIYPSQRASRIESLVTDRGANALLSCPSDKSDISKNG